MATANFTTKPPMQHERARVQNIMMASEKGCAGCARSTSAVLEDAIEGGKEEGKEEDGGTGRGGERRR